MLFENLNLIEPILRAVKAEGYRTEVVQGDDGVDLPGFIVGISHALYQARDRELAVIRDQRADRDAAVFEARGRTGLVHVSGDQVLVAGELANLGLGTVQEGLGQFHR